METIPYITSWTSSEWSAAGSVLLAIGALMGGLWTIYNYRKTRRYEAAKWLKELFNEFYVKDTFSNIRVLFEYNYADKLGPLLERRITDRNIPLSCEDIKLLKELDTLLNYFEYVLYLENEGQLQTSDRKAVFEYWFNLMILTECGGLRRYIDTFGFERLEDVLSCTQNKEYILLYGSLMKNYGELEALKIDGQLKFISLCEVKGSLYDLGDYPGLAIEDGIVKGELYEICDISILQALDKFERFYPEDRASSLYVRTCVKLIEPKVDAWIYVYNKSITEEEKISSGDWKKHKKLINQDQKNK